MMYKILAQFRKDNSNKSYYSTLFNRVIETNTTTYMISAIYYDTEELVKFIEKNQKYLCEIRVNNSPYTEWYNTTCLQDKDIEALDE